MVVTVNSNARAVGMWGERLAELLDDAVERTAEAVAETARQNAPIDTGALRESIYWLSWRTSPAVRHNAMKRARRRKGGVAFQPPSRPTKRGQALVVAGVFYAPYVERRTFFMAKARRQHENTFRNEVRRAVRATRPR